MQHEADMLATLPLPPCAFPEYPFVSGTTSDAITMERRTSRSKLPASASSAARSIAAAARSKLTKKNGRNRLSPDAKTCSSKCSHTESKTKRLNETAIVSDPLASMAFAAGSLTEGLSSSLATASSSFGSRLFLSQNPSVNNKSDNLDKSVSSTEEAAVQVLRQVTAQQRMTILENLVQCRRSDWNYLKVMHEGCNYWLNVALLREQQVMKYLGDKQSIRRGAQFFYLGIGLGKLVGDSMPGKQLATDCCQLLEELEFHFSSSTVQGMKMMVATSSMLHEPLDKKKSPELSSDEPFRPMMHKWNQRPVYRRLMTPPIPFQLDYREVLLSLCDILALVYSKLIGDNIASENVNVFQSIIRFDDRIKKLFIDPVKKEFSAVALQVMAEEMRLVRKSYASGVRDSEGSSCTFTTSVSVTASDPDNASQFSQ